MQHSWLILPRTLDRLAWRGHRLCWSFHLTLMVLIVLASLEKFYTLEQLPTYSLYLTHWSAILHIFSALLLLLHPPPHAQIPLRNYLTKSIWLLSSVMKFLVLPLWMFLNVYFPNQTKHLIIEVQRPVSVSIHLGPFLLLIFDMLTTRGFSLSSFRSRSFTNPPLQPQTGYVSIFLHSLPLLVFVSAYYFFSLIYFHFQEHHVLPPSLPQHKHVHSHMYLYPLYKFKTMDEVRSSTLLTLALLLVSVYILIIAYMIHVRGLLYGPGRRTNNRSSFSYASVGDVTPNGSMTSVSSAAGEKRSFVNRAESLMLYTPFRQAKQMGSGEREGSISGNKVDDSGRLSSGSSERGSSMFDIHRHSNATANPGYGGTDDGAI